LSGMAREISARCSARRARRYRLRLARRLVTML
jgi:hypothetical protein